MSYPQPPPSYDQARAAPPAQKKPSHGAGEGSGTYESLADASTSVRNGPWDEEAGEPLFAGVASDAEPAIRTMFVRKVYAALLAQILLTTVSSAVFIYSGTTQYLALHPWTMLVPAIGSFVTMAGVFWKRHSHPANIGFLAAFTVCEAVMVGTIVAAFQATVVMKALVITLFLFAGLTLFTLKSGWDFSQLGPWLWGLLWVLIGASFVQLFLPYSQTTDLVFAVLGALVFAGYIMYDTYTLVNRLSPDEWVVATVSLYLDIINLFINILRIVNGSDDSN